MPSIFEDAAAFAENVSATAANVYTAKAAYENAKSANRQPAVASSPSDLRQQQTPIRPTPYNAMQPAPILFNPLQSPVGTGSNVIVGLAAIGALVFIFTRIK